MKKLTKHLIVAAVLLAGFAAALGSYLLLRPDDGSGSGGPDVRPAARALPVRESSHRLTDPADSELTLV